MDGSAGLAFLGKVREFSPVSIGTNRAEANFITRGTQWDRVSF